MTIAASVTLDDKYLVDHGRVYLSGIQALVRLPMLQRMRDRAAGLNTAGFITGYRGSPLGGLDKELWKAGRFLAAHDVVFRPGLNEDLAATAAWGTQQTPLFEGARVEGVFAMWYGKGPGLDRSLDALKHANAAGTSPHGGVLVLAGDDHAARSSTLPHQSEQVCMAAGLPVLNPAGVQELIDYGLLGWALSRFAGLWVAMKATAETVDSSGTVDVDPWRAGVVEPHGLDLPPGGLGIRWPDRPQAQEERLLRHKLAAAQAFARLNRLDRVLMAAPEPRLGIVTTGKSALDVLQALDDLGIDARHAAEIGLAVYKVGMSWPLEPDGMRAFAHGLDEILVIEEKRDVLEGQIKALLYNLPGNRPRVVGKTDEDGGPLLAAEGELSPALIARVIAGRIDRFYTSRRIRERLDWLDAKEQSLAALPQGFGRVPYFCAGCPHNTSTNPPEGSRAMGGIGCHYMATWMPERHTETFSHMGGEGAAWIGQAPFTDTPHVFQNLGDGTYFHSGLLAIRACIAAGVNITYKILYNDAVAMTGGQPVDGQLSVPAIAAQLRAEGVRRIAVVAEQPAKYADPALLPAGTTVHARDAMDAVQRELRTAKGVSVLLYDQTCAAEKRRRRKRGLEPDPDERLFINELVCEGCGDCGAKSNCVAVVPVETEFGRKRAIDQSVCNKDYSCLAGFCPSFVSVRGGRLRRHAGVGDQDARFPALPAPVPPSAAEPFGIVVTGIGGTGVVTVAQILGMAAHLEGKGATALDQTGLAQKNGAVVSHVRLCDDPGRLHAARIAAGGARLLLACDLVVAAGFDTLATLKAEASTAVVNSHQTMPATFTHAPDLAFPGAAMAEAIGKAVGSHAFVFDATRLATALMGDALAANMLLVGYAWQKGLLPLSEEAILRAVELNGAAVAFNTQAFLWGRRAAHDPAAVDAVAFPPDEAPDDQQLSATLDEVIGRRSDFLAAYRNRRWARRYRAAVETVRRAEAAAVPGSQTLTEAAARSLFKLMSPKDEYEVARLYSDGSFARALSAQFESWERLEVHLAPPALGEASPGRKRRFGPWMLRLMPALAWFRWLRFTPFDPFGYGAERRMERALLAEYGTLLADLAAGLTAANHALAVDLARLPLSIRGFGPIKAAAAAAARAERSRLLARWPHGTPENTTDHDR